MEPLQQVSCITVALTEAFAPIIQNGSKLISDFMAFFVGLLGLPIDLIMKILACITPAPGPQ